MQLHHQAYDRYSFAVILSGELKNSCLDEYDEEWDRGTKFHKIAYVEIKVISKIYLF